ncbi:tripartite tricarboxylate transporter substrate binding protein [Sphaerochaeta sp. PS]|uniref:tripartite tricarboxylate transporter substrate binding protein n=1 Tax=Sphaerochaeta sp. PS TaxID=3076336 RepID=UPI0028A5343F|nr:tripartite tricarboxylate transporter substrate-binding protein [Sphaerochaeta sp. PS]MDT4761258.1 tripartite tricarboxylate transporter substrate-binding protein [Sphaerochaeta sp. PS]
MKKGMLILLCLIMAVPFALMANGSGEAASGNAQVAYPKGNFDFVAPAGAGGGWDLTIRTVAKALSDTKLVDVAMPVRNAPGAGGAVHLGTLQAKKGDAKIITVYSPPILFFNLNGTSKYGFRDTTPLARLIADYAAFVVKADSPYKTIMDVMDALKKDPKSVKIGGTSAAGSMDHVQFLIIARAAGVKDLNKIDYIAFDNDGATQVMGGHIDLFSTSLADVMGLVTSGDLRVLAQTAARRIGTGKAAEIPTCIESGINETFQNWRGLFGAPDMPDYAVAYWEKTLSELVKTPEWKAALTKYGWDDVYLNGPDFTTFLEKTEQDYKVILQEIGMI